MARRRPWRSGIILTRGRGEASGKRGRQAGGGLPAAYPVAEPVEVQVDDRGGIKGDELGQKQAADDGDAKGTAQFGAGAILDGERERAEERGHGGHHDGPEPEKAG